MEELQLALAESKAQTIKVKANCDEKMGEVAATKLDIEA